MKKDLLADEGYAHKVDAIGDSLQKIEAVVDFAALAQAVEKIAPRQEQAQGGRPPYPAEVLVRVLVVKRLYGLSDEQAEFQLLDRRSFRRFIGLEHSRNIPDRTTIWNFDNRIGVDGVTAVFTELDRHIRAKGLEYRAGQIVDATPWCLRPGSISPGKRKRFWIRTLCLPTGSPQSCGKRTWMPA